MLIRPEQQDTKPLVKWKDLLSGQWKGPDPLLTSGRGCASIFPQDADSPIWIPDRLIHHVTVPQRPGSRHAHSLTSPLPSQLPPPRAASRTLHPAPRTRLTAPCDLEPGKFVQRVRAREENTPVECHPDQRGLASERGAP